MKPKHSDSVPAPRKPRPAPPLAVSMLALAASWLAAGWASAQSLGREAPQGDAALHDLQLWESTPSRSLLDSAAAGRLATGDIRLEPGFATDVDRYTARTTASSLSLRAKTGRLSTVTAAILGSGGSRRGIRSSVSLNADDGHYYGVTLSGLEPGNNVVEIAVVSDGGNCRWLSDCVAYRLDVERSVAAVVRDIQVWSGAGPDAFNSLIGGFLGGLTGDVELVPVFRPARVDYIATVSGSQVANWWTSAPSAGSARATLPGSLCGEWPWFPTPRPANRNARSTWNISTSAPSGTASRCA